MTRTGGPDVPPGRRSRGGPRLRVAAAAAAVVGLAAAGCGGAPAAPGPLHADGVTVTFRPDPPVARRPATLCAQRAGGSPPTAARIWMPDMSMGPVPSPVLTPDASGAAACGQVLFVMGGLWDVALSGPGRTTAGPVAVEVAE